MKYYNKLMALREDAVADGKRPTEWKMHPRDSDEIMFSARSESGCVERVNAGMRLFGLDVIETTQQAVGDIILVHSEEPDRE